VNEILGEEIEERGKSVLGGMYAEYFIEPKALVRQTPQPKNDERQRQDHQHGVGSAVHQLNSFLKFDTAAKFAVDTCVAKRYLFESVGVSAERKAAVERF
jgi:hypothetical protein